MKHPLIAILALASFAASANAMTFLIDIDSTTIGGGNNTGPIATETGWTSLDATGGNGSLVTIDGIDFSIGSADGSRVRVNAGNANPNDLTGDFVFDDGGGQAVILFFGGAGDLVAGTWQVEMWVWDQAAPLDDVIIAYRENNAENIVTSNAIPDPVNPAHTFTFVSDGTSAYDVFVRENNSQDRARLNAVRLTLIPEPSSAMLMLGGVGAFLLRRQRRR